MRTVSTVFVVSGWPTDKGLSFAPGHFGDVALLIEPLISSSSANSGSIVS